MLADKAGLCFKDLFFCGRGTLCEPQLTEKGRVMQNIIFSSEILNLLRLMEIPTHKFSMELHLRGLMKQSPEVCCALE